MLVVQCLDLSDYPSTSNTDCLYLQWCAWWYLCKRVT